MTRPEHPTCGKPDCWFHRYSEGVANHLMRIAFARLISESFTPNEHANMRRLSR